MKRKNGKRIISLLLAGMMLVQAPCAALADNGGLEEVLILDDEATEEEGLFLDQSLEELPEEEVSQEEELLDIGEDLIIDEGMMEVEAPETPSANEAETEVSTECETETEATESETEAETEECLLIEEVLLEDMEDLAADGLVTELSGEGTQASPYRIKTADQLPNVIAEGIWYALDADITLGAEQQIETLAGVLDGCGHVITLTGKPLANTVSGTIQNLGLNSTTVIVQGTTFGSMAVTLTGTIQNSYSIADIDTSSKYTDIGGLVGTLAGGQIKNSYYGGSSDAMCRGGLAGINNSTESVISYSCFVEGKWSTGALSMIQKQYTNIESEVKTQKELQSTAVTLVLNKEIPSTGYYWTMPPNGENNGMPVLTAGTPPTDVQDKTVLKGLIDRAGAMTKGNFSDQTWSALQAVLGNARKLYENSAATQEEIGKITEQLDNAINGLLPCKPVEIPGEVQVISISSASDFSKMSSSEGKYYVLTQDITVGSNYGSVSNNMNQTLFKGVLDGQGHTIVFENCDRIFSGLETGAVVQNLGLKGKVKESDGQMAAPLGSNIMGAILNCYSDVSGNTVAGFGVSLNGGIISNSFAMGDQGAGAFFNKYKSGEVTDSYWMDTLSSSIPVEILVNSGSMTETEMKDKAFVTVLNTGRGNYGTAWGQSSKGFPYFGEDQEYVPGSDLWLELAGENKYPIAFQAYDKQEAQVLEDSKVMLSPDTVDDFGIAGTFALVGCELPEGSRIEWGFSQLKPQSSMAFDINTGELYLYGTGKAAVTATLIKADGTSEYLAGAAVVSERQQIAEIKLFLNDTDVTNGSYTVQGSERKTFTVKARYEGEETWENVVRSAFTYTIADTDTLYMPSYSIGTFYFKKPGTSSIAVSSNKQSGLSASVTLTSEYVPVKTVTPAISGTHVIHGRDGLSDGYEADGRIAFNHIMGSAIVDPANASNADKVVITSENEQIGYFENGEQSYVPKEAGTVTFTASIEDTNALTGESNTVTGRSEVTFVYKNPLTEITGPTETIEVASGEKTDLELTITGELSDQGYNVTEPGIKWTFDQPGIVQIVKKKSGGFKREEGTPDNNEYFPLSEYQIVGLSGGTVVATGTPVDTTNEVAPVKVTIKVTGEAAPDKDIDGMVAEGVKNAIQYIKNAHSSTGYAYGNEWLIFSLLRTGEPIEAGALNAYYDSVAAEVKTWNASQKPTDLERVALALTAMGRDITNVDGVNLAEMIYNSNQLTVGSNELIYALLAFDAADFTIPQDAKWNRDSIIAELLKFQNATTGGFGLADNRSSSVDLTAMALQALANYRSRSEVKTATEKAMVYLRKQMQDDFGFGNAEATAQVLMTLALLNIDPLSSDSGFGTRNWNMITNLMEYACADGGFSHSKTALKPTEMSTVQVLQGLSAYQMSKEGKGSYWNVNGPREEHLCTWDGGTVTKPAGCTTDGIRTFHCSCGKTKTEIIPMAGHRAGNWSETAATCTKAGTRVQKCMVCQTILDAQTIAAAGHKYGAWTTSKEATVWAAEEQTRNCTVCKEADPKTNIVGKKLTPVLEVPGKLSAFNIKKGKTAKFAVTMANGDAVSSVTSSKTKILKVSSVDKKNGKVTLKGQKTGTAKLTIKLASGKSRTYTVKVVKGTVKTSSLSVTNVTNKKLTLQTKKSYTLKYERKPFTTTQKVTYKSSNKKIAKVTSGGKITAVAPGKATITVSSGSKKVKIVVTVPGIANVKSSVSVKKNKTLTLKPRVYGISGKITYTSDKPAVATVDSKGKIKGIKKGNAKITVTAGTFKKTVAVKVK